MPEGLSPNPNRHLSREGLSSNVHRRDRACAGPGADEVLREAARITFMGKGRSNKIVGQTGEYLVAAELSRRGMIATTFTGNVPYYDIIASDENGRHAAIQVKAIRGGSWQFDLRHFCGISFRGRKQILGRKVENPIRRLVCVLVVIDKTDKRNDRFFICTWRQLRDLIVVRHKSYLARHGGSRPVSPKSYHTALDIQALRRFAGKWPVIGRHLH